MGASSRKTLKPKAARFCAYRERSVSEVREKLKKLGANQEDTDILIHELIRENFIDESRFAHAFVSDKFRFNKWGKIKIRQMLRQQQIDESVIEKALDHLPSEDYLKMIHLLVEQKERSLPPEIDVVQKKQKVIRFMLQKGFEYDLISSHL